MDLKKRVEKLEKARSSGEPQPPAPSQQFDDVHEMSIEEWNETYVKPYQERYRRKAERANSSD